MSELLLGTASWSTPSWEGVFYPPGTPPGDYLAEYARHFPTVEVDATYYRPPTARIVDGWNAKTPDGFLFAAKVPGSITHEKILVDCQAEFEEFLSVMRRLGSKLGCLLLQFPYFRKELLPSLEAFLDRLAPFLEKVPDDIRFAVELRNRWWLKPPLFELLRQRNIALALIDHPWMPTAAQYARTPGIITADFLYVRWLGDRYKIEEITKEWGELVVDRSRETQHWVDALRELLPRVRRAYAYYNNHYAGCAFESARLFQQRWNAAG